MVTIAICFSRTVVLYLLLIAAIRLMGKKQVGELEPTELVLAMLISDLASVPMQDFGIPLLFGVLPIIILLCITMILSVLTLKSVRFREFICGRPSLIVENGVLLQAEMARNRFTSDELMEELRLQGITDLSTVKYAILENSGQVSAILYDRETPATPHQLGVSVQESGLPIVLVSDGHLIRRNLQRMHKDEQWLTRTLSAHQLNSISAVFLLTVDETDKVYLVPKEQKA